MTDSVLVIPLAVVEAFVSLRLGDRAFALPIVLKEEVIQSFPLILSNNLQDSFQSNLNLLEDNLDPNIALYLLLRHHSSIYAITFVPYRAPEDECKFYLRHRGELVRLLGEELFEMSLICKEIGEITDARSWDERDAQIRGTSILDTCGEVHEQAEEPKDVGYKKSKCRLCDRRMKNKISNEALEALSQLEKEGHFVQIFLNSDLILALGFQASLLSPEQVSTHLLMTHPTFTFYRHPNKLLYFIFHSPDSSTVQQRMKHTMAIPGLVNIHAEGCGVHVDQKIEIHEPEDLTFERGDKKVGRFRSVYLRGEWQGTESQYQGLERDKEFYDAVQ